MSVCFEGFFWQGNQSARLLPNVWRRRKIGQFHQNSRPDFSLSPRSVINIHLKTIVLYKAYHKPKYIYILLIIILVIHFIFPNQNLESKKKHYCKKHISAKANLDILWQFLQFDGTWKVSDHEVQKGILFHSTVLQDVQFATLKEKEYFWKFNPKKLPFWPFLLKFNLYN